MKVLSFNILVSLASLKTVFTFHLNKNSNVRSIKTSLDAINRREAIVVSTASAASLLVADTPSDANAASNVADSNIATAYSFNGVYRDPKHPKGYRIIAGGTTKEGILTLQDDPNSEVFNIPVKSQKDEATGEITLAIDFSIKGGPSDLIATVNKDNSVSFPDGNKWQKEKGVVGVYIDAFAPYPKYRRVVRMDKGSQVAVEMVSGKKTFQVSGKMVGKNQLVVDFPGGKTCKGTIDKENGTVSWPDGNVWTKI